MTAPLVLASASPRRRQLLASLGLDFTVRPGDLDETPLVGEAAPDYVLRLARAKARAQARRGELVLAADTVVVLDGDLLGKPESPDDARRMLARIAGRRHTVLTGLALVAVGAAVDGDIDGDGTREVSEVVATEVDMAPMTAEEIDWYVATGEPLDKAGSYGIQGRGALFVEAVDGNYTNVVGLPLPAVYRLFAALGHDLRRWNVEAAPPDLAAGPSRRT